MQNSETGRDALDFIRDGQTHTVRAIDVLLDAILTPPTDDRGTSRHFCESARAIIGGYMAWARFGDMLDEPRALETPHRIVSAPAETRAGIAARIRAAPRLCGGLPQRAVEREAAVGKEESSSNFSTIANQLAFLAYPEMAAHTARSSFDPVDLAAGDVDLFVVCSEDTLDAARPWLWTWIAIPNAVAGHRPLERDLLVILDEMPRLGDLKLVMDGYYMAAEKGAHFWCFAQSLTALDDSWGKDKRRVLAENAEVLQVLGFPGTATEVAKGMSKAIGTATFESRSGTVQEVRLVANAQSQASEQQSVVRERLVTAEDLLTFDPAEQYLIAAAKDIPRDAVQLRHARYWMRPDSRALADPNPFVLQKTTAA